MMTDETDVPDDIAELARAHGAAAIAVLAEIMNDADAPAGVRVSAAKALLERGWGKAGTTPPDGGNRAPPVTHIEHVIIDHRPDEAIRESRATHSAERPTAGAMTLLPLRRVSARK